MTGKNEDPSKRNQAARPRVVSERLKDLDPTDRDAQLDRVRGGAIETLPQASYRHTCFGCRVGG